MKRLLDLCERQESKKGRTVEDLKKLWGIGRDQTRERIRELIAKGDMKCVMEKRQTMIGVLKTVPVYVKVKKK